jgi:hypothetical protein
MKKLPDICYIYLKNLFNYCLQNSYFPNCWKTAKIKVLRKKDNDLDNPASYRPISLIRATSRLFEKIINMRLMQWAEDEKILHTNQSGFRKHHSTQDNIFKILESCKNGLQSNRNAGIVLFDIEKAFDKAPHKGILRKLEYYNCPILLRNLLGSFLSKRKFFVDINGETSNLYSIKAGVPQGSPLSPLLFSLFINGIGKELDKLDIKFALFADDLTIWVVNKINKYIEKRLQSACDTVYKYFNKIGLKLNEKKCEYSIISNDHSKQTLNLTINNKKVSFNQNPKVLGIHLDPELKFKYHFSLIKKELISKINLLRILSSKANGINPNKLLTVYKSLILSKIQYSMLPYMITTKITRKELQIIQNTCLKIITRQPRRTQTKLIHTTLKVEKLDKRLSTMTCNYLAKAKLQNDSIKEIVEAHKHSNYKGIKRSILDKINLATLTPLLSTTQFT